MNINELQLQEMRHFAQLGRLSASMLHEISNPLTAALLQLELSDPTSPAIRKAKRNMQTLRRYVDAARQQISGGQGHHKDFALQPQIDQLRRILLPMARQAGVTLEIERVKAGYKMYGDPIKLQQIITNLVVNAIQAYERRAAYPLTNLVRVSLAVDDNWLRVQVNDWGKGIAATELSKIFEPFYSTKEGSNIGLGLAIVRQYVKKDFGGSIRVSSSPSRGTRFTIKIRRFAK